MKITSTTGIIVIVLVLINLGASAYISQSLATRIVDQSESSIMLGELDDLTAKVDLLTEVVEANHGHIKGIHELDPNSTEIGFETRNIVFGLIPATTSSFEKYVPYAEIIERDMNKLASELGSNLRFSLMVRDSHGQAADHLGEVLYMHSIGVDLIIGGMWGSHACASRSYLNDNNVLLFTPSGASLHSAVIDDNLFRLSSTEIKQIPAMAGMIHSRGVEALVVLQRGDSWADKIYDHFEPEYVKLGGKVVKNIRYAGEATEFSEYLEEAEEAAKQAVSAYGWEKVGVEIISFSEAVNVIREAKDYPTLYNLTWYGSDGTSNTQQFIDDSPEEVEHLKMYSVYEVVPESPEYLQLSTRYQDVIGDPIDFYSANTYDIAMILCKSVIEAGTTDVNTMKNVIRQVSNGYSGVTGLCTLDENDDRASFNFAIQSYFTKDGELGFYDVGFFSNTGEITWYED